MATFETITRVLAVASAAYPNFDLKPETVRVYLKLLADLPDELLEEASLAHIAQSAFFPTIAELRAVAFAVMEQGNLLPTGLEAWSEVEEQIRQVGHTGKPVFQNKLTSQLVQSMGWQNLCRSENLVADRAHFLSAYERLLDHSKRHFLLPERKSDLAAFYLEQTSNHQQPKEQK